MGPKVDALTSFVEATGKRSIICKLDEIEAALAGEAGTEISG
jgi:carbamate kinase